MVDFILIVVLAAIIGGIILYLYRAKKRGETCIGCPHAQMESLAEAGGVHCSGSDYKPRRKKLHHVKYQKIFQVEGMHCEHCKSRVEEAVGDIKGVAGKVNLKQGLLTVSYAEDVADDVIKARIERAGYHVV